jgi:glyoxylase-like metal-dependent hydrolase (beta-lactamase superfamily II)
MRVKRVSEHIARLEIPWRFLGIINYPVAVYLVREGSGYSLIDTGVTESAAALIRILRAVAAGHGPNQVLLTHAHPDHAGGLSALQLTWQPPVLCHRDEVPFVTGEMKYRQLPSRSPAYRLGRLTLKHSEWAVNLKQPLDGGQSIQGMVVIHLPGHTPGSIAFLHPQDRAVICGDVIRNFGGRLSGAFPLTTQDPQAARQAIRRLAELDCDLLLPSHGPPITGNVRKKLLRYLKRSRK